MFFGRIYFQKWLKAILLLKFLENKMLKVCYRNLIASYKFCGVKIAWADQNHTIKSTDGAFTYGWKCPGLQRNLIIA